MIFQGSILRVNQLLDLFEGDLHLCARGLKRAYTTGTAQSKQKSEHVFRWTVMCVFIDYGLHRAPQAVEPEIMS